jgi:hypothetical protein
MARRPSARVCRMLERSGLIVLITLVLVDVGSLRYALVVTPVARASFGVMNGALLVQARARVIVIAAPPGFEPYGARKPVDFYRHGYSTAWWLRGADEFWWWVKGRKPAPGWVRVTGSGVPRNAAPGAVQDMGDGTFMVASASIPGARAATQFRLEVPLWMPIALLGAPYLAVWARRWRRRRAPWQCDGCGYDLRGMNAEKCPECGRMIEREGGEGGGDAVAAEA